LDISEIPLDSQVPFSLYQAEIRKKFFVDKMILANSEAHSSAIVESIVFFL